MMPDSDLLAALRELHGEENVSDSYMQSGARYVRIKNLPVHYGEAYDMINGTGTYERDLGRDAE